MYWLSVSQGFCNALHRPTFQGRRTVAYSSCFHIQFQPRFSPSCVIFFFSRFICDCGADYFQGQQITHRNRQQKGQNKWKAAKILILIIMGEVDIYRCNYTCTASELSHSWAKWEIVWSLVQSVMSLKVKVASKRQRLAIESQTGDLLNLPSTLQAIASANHAITAGLMKSGASLAGGANKRAGRKA